MKAIQPTLAVGDGSGLVNPLIPPTGLAGGQQAGNGSTTASAVYIKAAATGTFVRTLAISGSANATWRLALTNTEPSYDSRTEMALQQMGPQDCLASTYRMTVSAGDLLPLAGSAAFRIAGNGTLLLSDAFFIRGGWNLEVHNTSTSTIVTTYLLTVVQDAPASLTPTG